MSNKKARNLTMFVQSIEAHPKEFGIGDHIAEFDIELGKQLADQLHKALHEWEEWGGPLQVGAFRVRLTGRINL